MTQSKELALLKLLAAVAWSDGQLTTKELNYLKRLMLRFEISDEEWKQLEPYLEAPVPAEEVGGLAEEVVRQITMPGEKRAILQHIRHIVEVDDTVTPEEQEALRSLERLIQRANVATILIGKIQRLSRSIVGATRREEEQLNEFINNKILFKLRRRRRQGRLPLESDPQRLHYVTLFGGLLGHIAGIDKKLSESEVQEIRRALSDLGGFQEEELNLILDVIGEESLRGLERHRLTAGFWEVSGPEDRRRLIECLFAVAAAEGGLNDAEVEEVRRIAHALGLTHRQFIEAKLRSKKSGPPA